MTDRRLGQTIAHFRIERVVGEGSLGRVYAGRDTLLERPVAIKVIAAPPTSGLPASAASQGAPAAPERFVAAARLIATWRHQHILPVHYANLIDGDFYLVTDFVEGQDLGGLLAEYRADGSLLPHEHVLLVGAAVASALDYAHEHGVVHRAVKPANVLIGADDAILLTDFGLALDQRRGSAGRVLSTPHYCAPEQARSSADAVAQSDLYSLGVMLYEMLTGTLPFDDPAPLEVALKHITAPVPSPQSRNPALNAATEAVLLRALRKQPADRYASGAELMRALADALRVPPARSLARHPNAAPRSESAAPIIDSAAAGEDPLIGATLGRYAIEAQLGQGGMARIYRGRDVRLDRIVAIKVIDLLYQHDPEYAMRFEREARAIARLDHPNIVHLYHYGESEGLLYMAMQYVHGRDLGALLADRRAGGQSLTDGELIQIVRNICFALDYAHEQGVIHRDVHPGNILIDDRGRAILTDFGLALMTAVGTRGEIFGTPAYISPEQAESSALVVPQSDLYAVGVIIYEIVAGAVPFQHPNPLNLAMLHVTQPPPPLRARNPAVAPALEAVVTRALAKQPRDRYPTGAALAAAVAEALQAEGR